MSGFCHQLSLLQVQLDRWELNIDLEKRCSGCETAPSNVINNYFSIGVVSTLETRSLQTKLFKNVKESSLSCFFSVKFISLISLQKSALAKKLFRTPPSLIVSIRCVRKIQVDFQVV